MQDKRLRIPDTATSNVHSENNKFLVPYLLICDGIEFVETETTPDGTIYFKFTPASKAREAINDYYQREARPIQPKDLVDAIEHYRDLITRNRRVI